MRKHGVMNMAQQAFLLANAGPKLLGRELAEMLRHPYCNLTRAIRFIDAGADLRQTSLDGWPILPSIVAWDYRMVFERLETIPMQGRFDVNAKDPSDGWTAFMRAAHDGRHYYLRAIGRMPGADLEYRAQHPRTGEMENAVDLAKRRVYPDTKELAEEIMARAKPVPVVISRVAPLIPLFGRGPSSPSPWGRGMGRGR